MENVVIELTINKWMLYVIAIALFASFISNMMALYAFYLKRQLAKRKRSQNSNPKNN